MAQSTPTRRALIGGAGLLAVAGVAQCAAPARAAATKVSPRIARLLALRAQADAALERYVEYVETPAHAALDAAKRAYVAPPAPPHRTTNASFININGERRTFSTDGFHCEAARRVRDDPTWADMCENDLEWRAAHLELADLADERSAIVAQQKALREQHDAAAFERLGIAAITKRSDQLSGREYRLWDALIDTPAASIADVAVKLDLAELTSRGTDDPHVIEVVAADVRRLAAGEVA